MASAGPWAPTAIVPSLGWPELLVLLTILLLLFGARRLPEIARSIGRSLHELRKARDE